jgi:NadR type nicotinamide-nucleotide adenylyltransferase
VAPVPRRIVLTGSEATGKTTLAEALARHYQTTWVPEFARGYAEARAGLLTAADVEPIARGQLAAEQAGAAAARRLVVMDTDLVSTVLYARHYYGSAPAWVERTITAYPASLYLLCDIDLAWSPDGVRDRGHEREAMHALFHQTLTDLGLVFHRIRGAGPARLAAAARAVDRWLAGGGG